MWKATVRDDLIRSTSLPGADGAGEVAFVTPVVCVVDVDLGEGLGAARTYIFDDGVPKGLAASFESAGWNGYFGYRFVPWVHGVGIPDLSVRTTDVDLTAAPEHVDCAPCRVLSFPLCGDLTHHARACDCGTRGRHRVQRRPRTRPEPGAEKLRRWPRRAP